jgi:hypothetical protein
VLIIMWATLGQPHSSGGNLLLIGVVSIGLFIAFAWLFRRIYSLCSIRVTTSGLSQSFLIQHGKLLVYTNLTWDDIEHVRFSDQSYHFRSNKSTEIELHTALFSDVENTIRTVRGMLPPRLLDQLDRGSS